MALSALTYSSREHDIMPAANSRAASILRASLNRRVEGDLSRSHRRTATHDTVLESYSADGDLVASRGGTG